MREYLGEYCSKCGKARLEHPRLYFYQCPFCKFSYYFDPAGKNPKAIIMHKSLVRKR